MSKSNVLCLGLTFGITALFLFAPELAFAQFGGFESRMGNLNNMLISKILPLVSILGLVYAVILAVTGDGAAKMRIVMVIGCSVLGFLAPFIIRWLQGVVG